MSKQHRLGRVEILGHAVGVQRARAKAHHAAIDVANGDHQPVAEAVVACAPFLIGGQQPGGQQVVVAVALAVEVGAGRVPRFQGEADAKGGQRLFVEGAVGHIGAGALSLGSVEQQLVIVVGGRIEQAQQAIFGRLLHLVHRPAFFEGDPGALGQLGQRLLEVPAVLLHDEGENITALAAGAKAAPGAGVGKDVEGGGFGVGVERAKTTVVAA